MRQPKSPVNLWNLKVRSAMAAYVQGQRAGVGDETLAELARGAAERVLEAHQSMHERWQSEREASERKCLVPSRRRQAEAEERYWRGALHGMCDVAQLWTDLAEAHRARALRPDATVPPAR